jgi:hypothetical protein
LYLGFGIRLDGVEDVRLLICQATAFSNQYSRRRLDVAIESLCEMSADIGMRMKNTKNAGKRMGKPALGGTFDAFREQPLSSTIVAYCVSDAYFLEELYHHGMGQISAWDLSDVKELCWEQVKATRKQIYRHWGREKANNPFWIPGDHYDDYGD